LGLGAEATDMRICRRSGLHFVADFDRWNPPAGKRTRRVAGLVPDTGQTGRTVNRKSENDLGHDVPLPAHVCCQGRRRSAHIGARRVPGARVGQTFFLGGVGRAARSIRDSGGFCPLTQTGSRTVRSEQAIARGLIARFTRAAQEGAPACGTPPRPGWRDGVEASWRFQSDFDSHRLMCSGHRLDDDCRFEVYTIPPKGMQPEMTEFSAESVERLQLVDEGANRIEYSTGAFQVVHRFASGRMVGKPGI